MLVECSRKSPCSSSLCSLPGPFSCLYFPLFLFTPSLWSGNTLQFSCLQKPVRKSILVLHPLWLAPGLSCPREASGRKCPCTLPLFSPASHPFTRGLARYLSRLSGKGVCVLLNPRACESCLTCPSSWLWAVLTTPLENLAFLQPSLGLP